MRIPNSHSIGIIRLGNALPHNDHAYGRYFRVVNVRGVLSMNCWLSKERSGLYMLTHDRPIIHRVKGTTHDNLYIPLGDPLGVRGLCQEGVTALWNVNLSPLQSIKVTLLGTASPENPAPDNPIGPDNPIVDDPGDKPVTEFALRWFIQQPGNLPVLKYRTTVKTPSGEVHEEWIPVPLNGHNGDYTIIVKDYIIAKTEHL